jgi:flagellar biogenesis protein FliO
MKKLTLVLFAIMSFSLNAKDIIVKSLESHTGEIVINTIGDINVNPNLTVKDKTVEILIPNAHVNTKIVKKFGEVTINATQVDRETVKVVAVLPSSLSGKEESVNITLKDGAIVVNIPKLILKQVVGNSKAPSANETPIADKASEKLDEEYLNKLESEQAKVQVKNETIIKANTNVAELKNKNQSDTDRVTVTQAGVTKIANEKPKSSFSIATYVGKFIAFLSLMILGFYGVLTLFKKGVIKKGRLGFLHSTKLVEVLSTTHIAPKRTLIMVKAHKQVFLVSNTEAGIQLISEIQDVTGLIKNGELEISGSNFETNLVDAGKKEKEFKLKEVKETSEDSDFSFEELMTETPAAKSIAKTPVKDDVRLSDQIKTKIKNLKQLQ